MTASQTLHMQSHSEMYKDVLERPTGSAFAPAEPPASYSPNNPGGSLQAKRRGARACTHTHALAASALGGGGDSQQTNSAHGSLSSSMSPFSKTGVIVAVRYDRTAAFCPSSAGAAAGVSGIYMSAHSATVVGDAYKTATNRGSRRRGRRELRKRS